MFVCVFVLPFCLILLSSSVLFCFVLCGIVWHCFVLCLHMFLFACLYCCIVFFCVVCFVSLRAHSKKYWHY